MNINEQFANANSDASDKITRHGYQRFYPFFLHHLRDIEELTLLEIGFHEGNSVTLWNNYFNKPKIHAIDIKDNVEHPALSGYYKVDQSKPEELKAFAEKVNTQFHFILDDGSHAPLHQWNTFIEFFQLLLEGGTYIIEDVETSFWGESSVYGYPINTKEFSLFKKLQALPYIINGEFSATDLKKKWELTDKEFATLSTVEMLTTGHNCFMLIKKDKTLYKNYYRKYEEYPLRFNIDSKRKDIIHKIKTNPRFLKLIEKIIK